MSATVTTAPTEEEIRAAIARAWGAREVEFSDAFTHCMTLLDDLYDQDDLRPSEDARLGELVTPAIDLIRDETQRRINEALVSAALAFAAEHPDAPRATRTLTIV